MIEIDRGIIGREGPQERHDRLIRERVHDPYKARKQPVEPLVCPDCGVVRSQGRWHWLDQPPPEAEPQRCPACQRIHDRVPAGYLILEGPFLAAHRDEILRLVHHKVDQQRLEHPMKRLMDMDQQAEDRIELRFTDLHLPRGVGEAIRNAYDGELKLNYTEEGGMLRAYWRR